MVFIVPLYDNIIKISLRKGIVNIFYEVSRKYYGVRESPLYEHRDVCFFCTITRFPIRSHLLFYPLSLPETNEYQWENRHRGEIHEPRIDKQVP